jgi:hypothetical protein
MLRPGIRHRRRARGTSRRSRRRSRNGAPVHARGTTPASKSRPSETATQRPHPSRSRELFGICPSDSRIMIRSARDARCKSTRRSAAPLRPTPMQGGGTVGQLAHCHRRRSRLQSDSSPGSGQVWPSCCVAKLSSAKPRTSTGPKPEPATATAVTIVVPSMPTHPAFPVGASLAEYRAVSVSDNANQYSPSNQRTHHNQPFTGVLLMPPFSPARYQTARLFH